MYINGVPNKISRKALVKWVEVLGVDARSLLRLELDPNAVVVTVKAHNEDLKPYRGLDEELAVHELTIEVTDDDE